MRGWGSEVSAWGEGGRKGGEEDAQLDEVTAARVKRPGRARRHDGQAQAGDAVRVERREGARGRRDRGRGGRGRGGDRGGGLDGRDGGRRGGRGGRAAGQLPDLVCSDGREHQGAQSRCQWTCVSRSEGRETGEGVRTSVSGRAAVRLDDAAAEVEALVASKYSYAVVRSVTSRQARRARAVRGWCAGEQVPTSALAAFRLLAERARDGREGRYAQPVLLLEAGVAGPDLHLDVVVRVCGWAGGRGQVLGGVSRLLRARRGNGRESSARRSTHSSRRRGRSWCP